MWQVIVRHQLQDFELVDALR